MILKEHHCKILRTPPGIVGGVPCSLCPIITETNCGDGEALLDARVSAAGLVLLDAGVVAPGLVLLDAAVVTDGLLLVDDGVVTADLVLLDA